MWHFFVTLRKTELSNPTIRHEEIVPPWSKVASDLNKLDIDTSLVISHYNSNFVKDACHWTLLLPINTLPTRRHAHSWARMSDEAITMTGTQNPFSPFVMVKLCKWSYQDSKHGAQAPVWVKLVLVATKWKSAILYISEPSTGPFQWATCPICHRHRAPNIRAYTF